MKNVPCELNVQEQVILSFQNICKAHFSQDILANRIFKCITKIVGVLCHFQLGVSREPTSFIFKSIYGKANYLVSTYFSDRKRTKLVKKGSSSCTIVVYDVFYLIYFSHIPSLF